MVMVRAGTMEGYTKLHGALPCPGMRRPQPAFRLVAVMSSLLVAVLSIVPASAAFAPAQPESALVFSATSKKCTQWGSQLTPPRTIKVLRTAATDPPAKVKGTVQTVNFYEYVATVMAAEWPERYPIETLKAGAVATKQFAWHHIVYPRGGTKWNDGQKYCYDVVDSTTDQWYRPEKYGPDKSLWPAAGSKVRAAIDTTWDVSLRKYKTSTVSSRFFLTGYRAGSGSATCGSDATGFKLFHNSSRKCGYDGLKYEEILRKYLKPNLEVVAPGRNDVLGTKHGDASAMERSSGQRTARVWTPGQAAPEAGSLAGISLSTDDLVDYASGDMNGDGKQDLVWLKRTGSNTGNIKVALSDGTNYGDAQEWWSGDTVVPLNGAHLLIGDFHADQRDDLAILGRGPSSGSSRMVVLKRRKFDAGEKFLTPVVWWGASQDFDRIVSAWLGDLSGDGRSDLIIRQHPDAGGVQLKTAVTKSPVPASGARMNTYQTRWWDSSLIPAKVKMTVGDANRDGRDDLILLVGGGGRAVVERLQGRKLGGLRRVKLWTAPKADPIFVEKTRLGSADVDYDGRSDLVLFTARGTGTRIRVLRIRYDTVLPGPTWRIGTPWNDIRPY
jgi:hypothetical protein